VSSIEQCLPVSARQHYLRLRAQKSEKATSDHRAKLVALRQEVAGKGALSSGQQILAEWELAEEFIRNLAFSWFHAAIETCSLYEVKLDQNLCGCIEGNIRDLVESQFKNSLRLHASEANRIGLQQNVKGALSGRVPRSQSSILNTIQTDLETARIRSQRKAELRNGRRPDSVASVPEGTRALEEVSKTVPEKLDLHEPAPVANIRELKEPSQMQPEKSHNLGDSVGICALAVALITWALAPTLAEKAVAIIVGAAILAYLAYRSHFTKSVPRRYKPIVAVLFVLLVLAGGGWQLWRQWKSENPEWHPALQPVHPAGSKADTDLPGSTGSTAPQSRPQGGSRPSLPPLTIVKQEPTEPSSFNKPGIRVFVTVDDMFKSPAFEAECSLPCVFVDGIEPDVSSRSEAIPVSRDERIAGLRFVMPGRIEAGKQVILEFRSRDEQAISLLSLKSYAIHSAGPQPSAHTSDSEVHNRHTLTVEEQKSFTEPLSSQLDAKEVISIDCPAGDEPVCVYAAQFVDLFKGARWIVDGGVVHRITLGIPHAGVVLGSHVDAPFDPNAKAGTGQWVQMTPSLVSVQQAFANIRIGTVGDSGPEIPKNRVEVYFGPEASPDEAKECLRRSLAMLKLLRQNAVVPKPHP
jgi:hypothetical protein